MCEWEVFVEYFPDGFSAGVDACGPAGLVVDGGGVGGVVVVDGHIYGSNWKGNGDGAWVCLDWNTGKVKYEDHWNNKGAMTYADGMLYCYEEKKGNVALVKVTPEKFDVVSFFEGFAFSCNFKAWILLRPTLSIYPSHAWPSGYI